MNQEKDETSQQYTVTVFTEDKVGLLNRITIVFTRRHLNIDSLTTSESEVKGIFRYTIVTQCSHSLIQKVVDQIEKLTEVLRAFYFREEEVIHQEIALYKVSMSDIVNCHIVEQIIRRSNARVLDIEDGYFVIEKTGYKHETQQLFEQLQPYGILQFARSGRVAVTKQRKELTNYLIELAGAVETSKRIRDWKLKN